MAQKILKGTSVRDEMKYVIHSAHDTQLLNILTFLNPYNYEVIDATYCSLITVELHYDDECVLNGKKDLTCFHVEVVSNGIPLKFDTCMDQNALNGSHSPYCDFAGFFKHWDKIKYAGDVLAKCKEDFSE